MKCGKNILVKICQTQKDKYDIMFDYMWLLAVKSLMTKLESIEQQRLETKMDR